MENNCYRRGYVVEPSPKPEEPLYEIVTTRKMEKVSPFKQINSCGQRYRPCSVAIRSFDGCSSCGGINGLMDESELPDLVNFLVMNGYDINERLTKLMERKMASDEKKLVFVCSYSG